MAATAFLNPVLEYLWSFLNAGIGILIIYEIVKLIGSLGGNGSGNSASPGNNAAVLNSFRATDKAEDRVEKDEQKDLGKISSDISRESTAADRAMRFGRLLHTLIISLIEHLERMKQELEAGTTNREKFQKELKAINDKLGKAITDFTREDSSAEWAYKIVSNEMEVVGDLHSLLVEHNKLVNDLRGEIQALPSDHTHKEALLREVATLAAMVEKFSKDVDTLAVTCREKARRMYSELKIVQSATSQLHSGVDQLKELKTANTGIIKIIDELINKLKGILKMMTDGEGFLSVFYTMNRDEKNMLAAQLNSDAEKIRHEHSLLRAKFNMIKTK